MLSSSSDTISSVPNLILRRIPKSISYPQYLQTVNQYKQQFDVLQQQYQSLQSKYQSLHIQYQSIQQNKQQLIQNQNSKGKVHIYLNLVALPPKIIEMSMLFKIILSEIDDNEFKYDSLERTFNKNSTDFC